MVWRGFEAPIDVLHSGAVLVDYLERGCGLLAVFGLDKSACLFYPDSPDAIEEKDNRCDAAVRQIETLRKLDIGY